MSVRKCVFASVIPLVFCSIESITVAHEVHDMPSTLRIRSRALIELSIVLSEWKVIMYILLCWEMRQRIALMKINYMNRLAFSSLD
jgi:hypothetical protein